MSNELEVIVKESGLDQPKAKFILEQFKDSFEFAAKWEKQAKTIVVTSENQIAEMKMARVGRLELREKRISIEKARKELKEQALREGKAIDGIANVLKALIVPIEEYLESQEKFIEIQEEKKRENLRLEEEKKIEEQLLENERLDRMAGQRREAALPYRDYWATSHYDFRTMSDVDFNNLIAEFKAKKSDQEKRQEETLLANERLTKEAAEKERKLKEETAAREEKESSDRKEREEKERKERQAHQEQIKKEQDDARRKQEEIQRKADEERKILQAKAEVERKEKERLAEIVKNTIECPKCHHKFQIKK